MGDASSLRAALGAATFPCATASPILSEIPVSEITSAQPKNPTTAGSCASPGRPKLQSSPIACFRGASRPRRRDHHPQRMRPASRFPPAPRRRRLILFSPLFCTDSHAIRAICVTLYPWTRLGKQGRRSAGRSYRSTQAETACRAQNAGTTYAEEQIKDLQPSRIRIVNDLASATHPPP